MNTETELHALVKDAQDAVEQLRQRGLSLLEHSSKYPYSLSSLEAERTLLKTVAALLNGAKLVTELHQSLISIQNPKKKPEGSRR